MSNNGIVYAAIGARYVDMARQSAQSVKKICKNVPIKLVTDSILPKLSMFDIVEKVQKGIPNRYAKLSVGINSPFDKTLYLDCDTVVLSDPTVIFSFLDNHDLAVCCAQKSTIAFYPNTTIRLAELVPNATHFAGGIFAFSQRICPEFFNLWLATYKKLAKICSLDQLSLSSIIYNSKVNVYPLSSSWNVRPVWGDSVYSSIKILHSPLMHKDPSLIAYLKNRKAYDNPKNPPRWVKNR